MLWLVAPAMSIETRIDSVGTAIHILWSRLAKRGFQFEHPAETLPGPEQGTEHSYREIECEIGFLPLAQLPQYRPGNRLKIRVPSFFQSLFGRLLSQVFTGRMISIGTPSASYRTLWSGSGVALRRIRSTPFWSVGRTIVAIS